MRLRMWVGGCSSVGRAPHLHCGGRRFEARSSPIAEGAVAQLGEHLICKQEVTSSILVSSTIVRYISGLAVRL